MKMMNIGYWFYGLFNGIFYVWNMKWIVFNENKDETRDITVTQGSSASVASISLDDLIGSLNNHPKWKDSIYYDTNNKILLSNAAFKGVDSIIVVSKEEEEAKEERTVKIIIKQSTICGKGRVQQQNVRIPSKNILATLKDTIAGYDFYKEDDLVNPLTMDSQFDRNEYIAIGVSDVKNKVFDSLRSLRPQTHEDIFGRFVVLFYSHFIFIIVLLLKLFCFVFLFGFVFF